MEDFLEFIEHINNGQQRARTQEVLEWVKSQFPNLEARIAWNQPMFTEHGTFIIGFSVSSKHLAVSPERCRIAERTQIRAPGLNGQPGEPGKTPKTPQVQQKSVEANPKKKKKIAAQ